MIVVRDIEQGTPEWLGLRAGVLTASTFPAMLANGRGGKPSVTRQALVYQLATERITGRSAEDGYSNYWMDRGKEMEARARSLYEIETGADVETVAFAYLDESRLIGCSPDGLVGDELVEIKCPKLSTHVGYLLDGGLPTAYRPQVQGQMMVTGAQWCDFCSFCPDSNIELFRIRIERDEGYIENLQLACALLLSEVDSVAAQLRELAEHNGPT